MNKYYVTFGQQYRTEPHPKVRYAHPDGWLTVYAENMVNAREKTFEELGAAWSFLYNEYDFEAGYFPLGELHKI